ncbi:MAG: isochorismatase family protein [Planctomycetes bacterium]|nr:isochorismatase family protein [Planctomycetota bacterium]
MKHPSLLDRENSVLLVIDVQKKLVRDLLDREGVLGNVARIAQAARRLGVPTLLTEQNPDRLGPTVEPVAEALAQYRPLAKACFSSFGHPEFLSQVTRLERKALVLCGLMTHVCVLQTALEALARGYVVHVLADAVSCWRATDQERGLGKMRDAGAILSTTEIAVYEWLGRADTDEFKDLLPLLRRPGS